MASLAWPRYAAPLRACGPAVYKRSLPHGTICEGRNNVTIRLMYAAEMAVREVQCTNSASWSALI